MDNDGDGMVDESDPSLGQPCNEGMACQAGVQVCTNGQLVCSPDPQPDDLDGDGIPDSIDTDDDGDGIPDIIDEFPTAVVISDRTIGFDVDDGGSLIAHGQVIDNEYVSSGVRFRSGYRAARRDIAFSCYARTNTRNLLCTPVGASGGACDGPSATNLVVDLDEAVDFASIELRTRCDGPIDGDAGRLLARDANGNLLAEDPAYAHTTGSSSYMNEALDIPSVLAPGIRKIVLEPGDFDSADNLRLVRLAMPCAGN